MQETKWLENAKRQNAEMSEAEVQFFSELRQRNRQDNRIFARQIRAFKKLIKLARSGNEYAEDVLKRLTGSQP